MNLLLSGPPGAGKTTIGRLCAERLNYDLIDTDEIVATRAGQSIPEIFVQQGEAAFRALEHEIVAHAVAQDGLVIALGGGSLLDGDNRALATAAGTVVCLRASEETIRARLGGNSERPLLQAGEDNGVALRTLLRERAAHYDSFTLQLQTDMLTPEAAADHIVAELMPWYSTVQTTATGRALLLGTGTRAYMTRLLREHELSHPAIIVTDTNVEPLWAGALGKQLGAPVVSVSAGETHKTLAAARDLYDAFLQHDLDRHSLILAVGGGVIGDLAGFAAATFMRGVSWVNMPTSLLAMVDASIGGKVGVDLPQGKNLVGAFHPPDLVLADTELLETLPPEEYTSGMAEVLKHGIIADAELFDAIGPEALPLSRNLLQRALAVKVEIVQRDPYEKGERAKLNLGHTIGHGIEVASDFALRHGEAIGIGLLAETRLAERIGMANVGISDRVAAQLQTLGLPTGCPGLSAQRIRTLMSSDKKKRAGELTFALPTAIGEVEYGLTVEEALIQAVIAEAVA